MKALVLFTCIALATANSARAEDPAQHPLLTDPKISFAKGANAAGAIMGSYPAAALAEGLEGKVKLTCHVTAQRKLDMCSVDTEEPAGRGFGAGAIHYATNLEVAPRDGKYKRVEDGWASVPVTFSPPMIPPAPLQPHWVIRPIWTATPNVNDLNAVYPRDSTAEGATSMQCLIGPVGRFTACQILTANPPNQGFEGAAITLANLFQMKPVDGDGQQVDGGTIIIPIVYRRP
jgi:TonB family protein